ncbi:MAG: CHAT domain-containing protein, partial [Thermoanaerobaculia bacterium]
WDTNDDPSSELLLRFHDLLRAGADPLTALRQAQLDLLRGPDRHLASPHTWAAFQVTGGAFASANDLSPPPAASPQSR